MLPLVISGAVGQVRWERVEVGGVECGIGDEFVHRNGSGVLVSPLPVGISGSIVTVEVYVQGEGQTLTRQVRYQDLRAAFVRSHSEFDALGEEFGSSMAFLGDLNGDGWWGEVVVGGMGVNRVEVVFLGEFGEFSSSVPVVLDEWEEGGSGENVGASIVALGDVNGDFFDGEVGVGAPGDGEAGSDAGAVYLLQLSGTGDVEMSWKLCGGRRGIGNAEWGEGDEFGWGLARIGEGMFAVGGNGVVVVVEVNTQVWATRTSRIEAGVGMLEGLGGMRFGRTVVCGSCWGGVVGVEEGGGVIGVGTNSSSLHFVALNSSLDVVDVTSVYASSIVELEDVSDVGKSVSVAGDLDGDGGMEMLVGAEGSRTFLLSLSPEYSLVSAHELETPQSAVGFGRAVSIAGDLDHDGIPSSFLISSDSSIFVIEAEDLASVPNTTTLYLSQPPQTLPLQSMLLLDPLGVSPSRVSFLIRESKANSSTIIPSFLSDLSCDSWTWSRAAQEWPQARFRNPNIRGIHCNSPSRGIAGDPALSYPPLRLYYDSPRTRPISQSSSFLIHNATSELPPSTVPNGSEFGASISSSLGDLDGDGWDGEVVVGAPGFAEERGSVVVVWIGLDGVVNDVQRIANGEGGFGEGVLDVGDRFGSSVVSLGSGDVIVGAEGDDSAASNTGALHWLTLAGNGSVIDHKVLLANSGLPAAGNGNLIAKFLVYDEARKELYSGGVSGIPYVGVLGEGMVLESWTQSVNSEEECESLALANDLDGVLFTTTSTSSHLFLAYSRGNAVAAPTNFDILEPISPPLGFDGDVFGGIVSLGDLNADGLDLEFIIGCPNDESLVFLMLDSNATILEWRVVRFATTSGFGKSVGLGGNLWGDGWSLSVLVGVDDGILGLKMVDMVTNPNISTIFLGTPTTNSTLALQSPGEATPLKLDPFALSSTTTTTTTTISRFPVTYVTTSLSTTEAAAGRIAIDSKYDCVGGVEVVAQWPRSKNPYRGGIVCHDGFAFPLLTQSPQLYVEVDGKFLSTSTPVSPTPQKPYISDTSPIRFLPSNLAAKQSLGSCITWLGDVDGDGNGYEVGIGMVDEQSVGIVWLDEERKNMSRATLIESTAQNFGSSMTSLFDADGDGIAREFVVGAVNVCPECGSQGDPGALFVVFLSPDGSQSQSMAEIASGKGGLPEWDLYGLGSTVALVGDWDGDGVMRDLVVGACGWNGEEGTIAFLWLNASGLVEDAALGPGNGFSKEPGDEWVGFSVAFIAQHKLAVSARMGDLTGVVYVLNFDPKLDRTPNVLRQTRLTPSSLSISPTLPSGLFFGMGLVGLGDLDGDGIMELGVGARQDTLNREGYGFVLFLGEDDGLRKTVQLVNDAKVAGDDFGWSICRFPTKNVDEFAVAISSPRATSSTPQQSGSGTFTVFNFREIASRPTAGQVRGVSVGGIAQVPPFAENGVDATQTLLAPSSRSSPTFSSSLPKTHLYLLYSTLPRTWSSVESIRLGSSSYCLRHRVLPLPRISTLFESILECDAWLVPGAQSSSYVRETGVEVTFSSSPTISSPIPTLSFFNSPNALAPRATLGPTSIQLSPLQVHPETTWQLEDVVWKDEGKGVQVEVPGALGVVVVKNAQTSAVWSGGEEFVTEVTLDAFPACGAALPYPRPVSVVGIGGARFQFANITYIAPSPSSVEYVNGYNDSNLLDPAGGTEIIVRGVGFGEESVFSPSSIHRCYGVWFSRGLLPVEGWNASTIAVDRVMGWVYVGGRPCLEVEWRSNAEVKCVAPEGLGEELDVNVVVGGTVGGLRGAVDYGELRPVSQISPTKNLNRDGGDALNITAPVLSRLIQPNSFLSYVHKNTSLGPWKVVGDTIPEIVQVVNDTSVFLVGVISSPGVGGSLVGTLCFEDNPWSATPAGLSLSKHASDASPRKGCTSTIGAATTSYTPPTLLVVTPAVGLAPLGGTAMYVEASGLGDPALLALVDAEPIVRIETTVVDDVVQTSQGSGVERFSFVAPPAEVTNARVTIEVFGAFSNALSASYTQVYLISFEPQRVIPGNGNLRYTFFLAVTSLGDSKVDRVWIGNVPCENPRRQSSVLLVCEKILAPTEWTSSEVWLELDGGNRTTPKQTWLRPLPPPALQAIESGVDGFPVRGGVNVSLLGQGLGANQGDLVATWWGGDSRGWIQREPPIWMDGGTMARSTLPEGSGENMCLRIETRGGFLSNSVCLNYNAPSISRISPSYALQGEKNMTWNIWGGEFGRDVSKIAASIGGMECEEVVLVESEEKIECIGLQWTSDDWSASDVVVSVDGQSVSSSKITLYPPPAITATRPASAGPGDTVYLSVDGLGDSVEHVLLVEVGLPGELMVECEGVKWVKKELECNIPSSHPLWTSKNHSFVPAVSVQVTSSTGIQTPITSTSQFSPIGIRSRPVPGIASVVGVSTWRPRGQPRTLVVRWRFLSQDAEGALLASVEEFEVAPGPITSFEIQWVVPGGKEGRWYEVQRDSSVIFTAVPGEIEPNSTNAWDTYEAKITVATELPVHARVRALNADGTTNWVESLGEGASESCLQDQYLSETSECDTCPFEAVCAGLPITNVTSRAGFWRVDWGDGVVFAQCLREAACLGWSGPLVAPPTANVAEINPVFVSYANTSLLTDDVISHWMVLDEGAIRAATTAIPGLLLHSSDYEGCAKWHHGVLCDQCKAGSFPSINGGCEACGSSSWIAARLVLLGCVMAALLALILWRAWKTRAEKSSREVLVTKLLLAHLQAIAIVSSIDIRWPKAVAGFFGVVEAVASATTSGLALECLLGKGAEDPFARTGVVYSSPLWLLTFAALFWAVHGCVIARGYRVRDTSKPQRRRSTLSERVQAMSSRRPSWVESIRHETNRTAVYFDLVTYREQVVQSFLVIAFLLHTPISKAAFRIMTCRPVGPTDSSGLDDPRTQLRLSMDMNYICTGNTLGRMVGMGLPVVLCFSFGLPIAAWIFLRQQGGSRRVGDPLLRSRLGFYYNGYSPAYFYWESIVLLRKVTLAMVTVLLGPYGGGIQALTALLLILFSLVLQSWAKPYEEGSLNKLELFALVVAAVTLVGGLYVVFDNLVSPLGADGIALVASLAIIISNVLLLVVALAQLSKRARARLSVLWRWVEGVFQWLGGVVLDQDEDDEEQAPRKSFLWRSMRSIRGSMSSSGKSVELTTAPQPIFRGGTEDEEIVNPMLGK